MRPQTIRRLLVFAVCCAGVAALYLAPGTAESPDQVSSGPGTQPDPPTRTVTKQPEPTGTPSPQATVSATPAVPTATETVTARPTATSSNSPRPEPTSSSSAPEDEESDSPTPEPSPTATATDEPEEPEPEPTDDPPADPPEKVEGVEEVEATHEELTLSWTVPDSDEDIKNYRIYLNGRQVEAQHPVSPTQGTIGWEINSEDGYFVQVSAVDIDDQEGDLSDRLTVTRPEDPSPSPSPPETPETPEGEGPNGDRTPSAEPTR